MNEYFSSANVGNKVWDLLFGWGNIENIKSPSGQRHDARLKVYFPSIDVSVFYYLNGKETGAHPGNQRLFWDEIPIASYAPFPPPKPKKKVLQHGYALITTYKYPRTGETGMEKIEGPFHDLGVAEAALCISGLITGREKQVVAFTYEVEE